MGDSVIHGIEANSRVPLLDTVEKLACALGMSPSMLAYGIEAPVRAGGVREAGGVGRRLAEARQAQGVSKRILATKAGVARATILYIEEGQTMPTVAMAEQLAQALGVSPGWLAYGEVGI
jgi:transcriptional regulator with XRE-family HTH domain